MKVSVGYIYSLLLLIGANIIYNRYQKMNKKEEQIEAYELIKKYLLNESSLAKSTKPIIWIHNIYEVNSRWWANFQSRNTTELNQPYLYLTIKSIIDKCGDNFNICLIDDSSFKNILPGWTIDLHQIGDPVRSKIRDIALAKTLHAYGGCLVPSSFICLQNLNECYDKNTANGKMFVGEFINRNCTSTINVVYAPTNKFMGCIKDCNKMKEYINYLEILASRDLTAQSIFIGNISCWLNTRIQKGDVILVSADKLGAKDENGKSVMLERLMNNSFINFADDIYGVYVPADDLLKRTKYNWFVRLSPEQVLESDTIIGKQLLVAQSN
jgi:hypothetical protein